MPRNRSIKPLLKQKVEDIPSGSEQLQLTRDSKRIVSPRPMLPGEILAIRSNRLRNVAYEYVTMQSEGTREEQSRDRWKARCCEFLDRC